MHHCFAKVTLSPASGQKNHENGKQQEERKIRHGCCPNQVHELKTFFFLHGKENSLISFPCFQLSSSSKLLSFFFLLLTTACLPAPSPSDAGLNGRCSLLWCCVCNCFVKFSLPVNFLCLLLTGGQGKADVIVHCREHDACRLSHMFFRLTCFLQATVKKRVGVKGI